MNSTTVSLVVAGINLVAFAGCFRASSDASSKTAAAQLIVMATLNMASALINIARVIGGAR